MIASLIGKVLLRELPGYVAKQIVSRQAHVYGSVLYSAPQRRVLGYLQEAAPLALTGVALANPTTAPAGAAALVGKLGSRVIDTNKRVVGIEAGVGLLEKGLAGVHVAALAACNETVTAQDAAADGVRTLERLTGGIGLADMVRHRVAEAGVQSGSTAWTVALAEASEEARPMVRKMRARGGTGHKGRATAGHRTTRHRRPRLAASRA